MEVRPQRAVRGPNQPPEGAAAQHKVLVGACQLVIGCKRLADERAAAAYGGGQAGAGGRVVRLGKQHKLRAGRHASRGQEHLKNAEMQCPQHVTLPAWALAAMKPRARVGSAARSASLPLAPAAGGGVASPGARRCSLTISSRLLQARRQERGSKQLADAVQKTLRNAASMAGLTPTVPACLPPPSATLAARAHRVVCSLVRKNPSGCLALKDPEMRLIRQAAAPTLAQ